MYKQILALINQQRLICHKITNKIEQVTTEKTKSTPYTKYPIYIVQSPRRTQMKPKLYIYGDKTLDITQITLTKYIKKTQNIFITYLL